MDAILENGANENRSMEILRQSESMDNKPYQYIVVYGGHRRGAYQIVQSCMYAPAWSFFGVFELTAKYRTFDVGMRCCVPAGPTIAILQSRLPSRTPPLLFIQK